VVLSSRPYCSSKMVQLPIQQEHPWRSFRECFWITLFHCEGSFHGLHVHLISLPVIISYGGTSKRKWYNRIGYLPWSCECIFSLVRRKNYQK
jgi:hypothetical protein